MSKKHYIGIDLGATKINGGIVSEDGEILHRYKTPTPKEDPQHVLDALVLTVKELLKFNVAVESIGIGSPGKVNPKTGALQGATPNMKGWHHTPLRPSIAEHFNLPVYVDNDANAAAWGEYCCGAGKGFSNMVMFTLGTGVGGGIIADDKLIQGTDGKGAELGHIIVQPRGRKCNCGQAGCLESYSSGTGIKRASLEMIDMPEYKDSYLQQFKNDMHGHCIFEGAEKNDPLSLKIIYDMHFYLSIGILDAINIFAPEVVLIGGGISNQGDKLVDGLKKVFKEVCFDEEFLKPDFIRLAKLQQDAGIIGAALLGYKIC